ncbi:MAG: prolyl oligopeptidase family serine peptidase [Porticoccaceae bacterium]|nr:prolyl oligopeptidase family serine peptidase [Porticoccaceae bacterium]
MTEKKQKPFGSWPSPISAELITRAAPGLNCLQSYGESLYWVESRPWEGGRNVIMCRTADGSIIDLLPKPYSHSSRVHEYGGMAYAISEDSLYFVNASDQRIYKTDLSGESEPRPITGLSLQRFADLIIDHKNQRLIAVCEEHKGDSGEQEPENYLVAVSLNTENPSVTKLETGADFYAYPRISPDQKTLCWIQWQHPNMPWDCTQLWQASINSDGSLTDKTLVAGASNNESIFQPQWSPDNQLYFVSDRNNWWNIYRAESDGCTPVLEIEAEFATPLWQFGMNTYDFVNAQTMGCLWTDQGIWHSGFIDIASGQLSKVDCQYSSIHAACCFQGSLYMVAGAAAIPGEVVKVSSSDQRLSSIYAPSTLYIDPQGLSQPQSILFPTSDGELVHAFFYPPANEVYCGEDSELPLVIALCHGGPTGATDSGLNLKIQYWTSRGFAVVDINYRGSTGFGRSYRQSLAGAWGIADVQDSQSAIAYLTAENKIDPERCIIRGGSAGGYTVLSALTFTDTFKAGASLYGIGDLETLATDTHKFESRYMDSLIGPYPERKDIYLARSPIHHAEGLNCPVIFLQGLEDKVVPPNQAEMMVKLLEDKGIKVGHITFPDEGHGFRKAANIIRAMESELDFYTDVFDLANKNSKSA